MNARITRTDIDAWDSRRYSPAATRTRQSDQDTEARRCIRSQSATPRLTENMGITYNTARMLWEARVRGAAFHHTLTIGHQSLFLQPPEVKSLQTAYSSYRQRPAPQCLASHRIGEYSDSFFHEFLDVDQLEILDNSAYENATLIHDLNLPVGDHLSQRFDVIIDGGSLEHIFNFPVAISNLIRMTKVGGTIFLANPANNLCGHGFYQFSPELMYRVFSPENGFDLRQLLFLESDFPGVERTAVRNVYQVADPAQLHHRVMLQSKTPVTMLVEATRISDVQPFSESPQQSDYLEAWSRPTSLTIEDRKRFRSRVLSAMPKFLQHQVLGRIEKRRYSFANRRFYKSL
jgi:hypothetical protein